MISRILQSLFALVLLASLTGCTAKAKTYRAEVNPDLVQTIVSLSPSTTEVFSVAGVNRAIIGKTEACNFPANLNARTVVKGTKPDYELIASMKPDLVVYDKNLYSEADIAKFKDLNLKTYAYGPQNLEEYEQSLVEISQLLNQESNASQTLDKIYAAVEEFQASIPQDGLSAIIATGGGSGDYYIAGDKSYQVDLLSRCHLKLQAPSAENFVPVNVEQIIQWNPDMIIATESTANAIFKDPRLAGINAVKNKAVLGVSDDVLLRIGVRQDLLLGALATQAQRIYLRKQGNN